MGMPALWFRYTISPMRIEFTYSIRSLTDQLVQMCAIIGGVYCVSSIVESLLRNGPNLLGFGEPERPKRILTGAKVGLRVPRQPAPAQNELEMSTAPT